MQITVGVRTKKPKRPRRITIVVKKKQTVRPRTVKVAVRVLGPLVKRH